MGEFSHLEHGTLQTAALQFEHKQTKSIVDLIATVHFGTKEYYDAIHDYAMERERVDGSQVHYEKITSASRKDLDTADESTRRAVVRSRKAHAYSNDGLTIVMQRGLGLVHQLDGLACEDSWENHDMTSLEMVEGLGTFAARLYAYDDYLSGLMSRFFSLSGLARPAAVKVLEELARNHDKPLPPPRTKEDKIVTIGRNAVALAAVNERRQQAPGSRSSLIWGAQHARYMKQDLLADGYEQLEEARWFTVATLIRPR